MKIFIGITEIARYYANIKEGFEQTGIHCTYADLSGAPSAYLKSQKLKWFEKIFSWVGKKNASTLHSGMVRKIFWKAIKTLLSVSVMLWTLPTHEVYIFSFGISFFFLYDLPLLKWLKKKIIFVFNGSDIRPHYIGFPATPMGGLSTTQLIDRTKKQKRMAKRIEKYADAIICNTLTAVLLEKPFIQFSSVGIPFPAQPINITKPAFNDQDKPVRILHSPSNPGLKGTEKIRIAIQNLQQKGYKIEFVEVIGKPNSVVLQELSQCDFVVDQLYSDLYMSIFAVEAAAHGKPAVVAGYAVEELLQLLPAGMLPPSHYCHPDKIESAIEKMVTDIPYRIELGQRAHHLIETEWSHKQVAERYLQIIRGEAPLNWFYNPQNLRYLYGCGIAAEYVKTAVRNVIKTGSLESLQLSDKPELETLYLKLAQDNEN